MVFGLLVDQMLGQSEPKERFCGRVSALGDARGSVPTARRGMATAYLRDPASGFHTYDGEGIVSDDAGEVLADAGWTAQ